MRFALMCVAATLSGTCALVYELVWIRRLGEIFGQTAYAINVVLAIFFAGMGVGAWLVGRVADRRNGAIHVFCVLELVIGVSGLSFLAASGAIERLYLRLAPAEWPLPSALAVKSLLAFVLLVLPTLAMGGTLPALARHVVRRSTQLGSRLAWLYGLNTLGAAGGVLLTTFCLIPSLGIPRTLVAAALGNLAAAALAFASRLPADAIARDAAAGFAPVSASPRAAADFAVLGAAAALSGFLSVGYEVLWTRALAARFLSTVYSFAVILFVFLAALGAGSLAVAALNRLDLLRRATCAWTQVAAGVLGLVSIALLGVVRPAASSDAGVELGFVSHELRELGYALVVMTGPVLLFGVNFPLIVSLAHRELSRVGRELGWIYLLNTIGSVAAPAVIGSWLLPSAGLKRSLVTLAWCGVLFGAGVLLPWARQWRLGFAPLAVASLVAAWLVGRALPGDIRLWSDDEGDRLLEYRDGVSASIAVVATRDGELVLKLDNHYGLGDTRSRFAQQRQGLIPLLLHPSPRQALFLGVGTGCSAGAAVAHGGVAVDALEIVPEVAEVLPHFKAVNFDFMARAASDPTVRFLPVDARHFVRNTRRRYDVVVGDLFVPWHAGEGAMYTREHFQAVREVLAERGFFCQWLPLYQLGDAELKTVTATFCDVFPRVEAWWLYFNVQRPAIGLVGSSEPLEPDVASIESRLAAPARRALVDETGLGDLRPLVASRIAGRSELIDWCGDVPLETRDRPRIEFIAPLGRFRPTATVARSNIESMQALARASERADMAVRNASSDLLGEIRGYRVAIEHYLRGQQAELDSSPADALEQYVAALDAAPTWPLAAVQVTRSLRWASRERRMDLVRTGAEALKRTPQAHLGHYFAALVARQEAAWEEAIKSVRAALDADPDHVPSQQLLRELLEKTRDPAR